MVIVIDKAILHILDFNSGLTLYSDELLDLDDNINLFLAKHIEKSYLSQDAKKGTFYDDSTFKTNLTSYLNSEIDFVKFSKEIARSFEQTLVHAEEMNPADIIIAEARIDDVRQLVIFKADSHIGYIHQVQQTENGIKNEIINHYSIMPSLSQKITEFAFVDMKTQAISLAGKKYTIDGNTIYALAEIVLECEQAHSPKETIKALSKTAAKVAETYGMDKVTTEVAVKQYVTGNMQQGSTLDLAAAGKEIFNAPAMQDDLDNALKQAGFSEPVEMNPEFTIKKMCQHKLKTDTGIELTIPADYFNNTEYIEFNNLADGSLSITLKHINNIVNK